MTGATLKALNPVIANHAARRRPQLAARQLQQLHHLAGRLHLPDAAGHAGAAGQYAVRRSTSLLRARAYLQQIVHQTTHSLARFFLEIDANYKQFKTASRLRAAAALRLESQRAYYEEGRITIDRFLDAVSQYATAVATEAQYKTTYNISIVALEEAKGTLLAYDNIAVAEGPHPSQGVRPGPRHPGRPSPVPHSPDGPQVPKRQVGPLNPDPVDPIRRRVSMPPKALPLPGPAGPLGPPPSPLPPYTPARLLPILSQNDMDPARERPAPRRSTAGAAGPRRPTSGSRRGTARAERHPRSASLIDPAVPGMGAILGRRFTRAAGAAPELRRRLACTSAAPGAAAGPATAPAATTAPAGGRLRQPTKSFRPCRCRSSCPRCRQD